MIEPLRTPSPTPPGPGRPQRASDADRAYVSSVVHRAVGMGMLSLDEAEDRLGEVYASQYRSELGRLIEDLPVTEPPMGAPAPAPQSVDRWERVQAATYRGAETAQQVLTRSRIGAWLLFLLVFLIILSLLANSVPMGHGGPPGGGGPGGGGGMSGR